ncbi:MAG TPA: tetratricopeptide repeat protein [Thermoleophilia bacterium]|nr:tetratricopeptide repeat protein [Thermoleophilia bacterium]
MTNTVNRGQGVGKNSRLRCAVVLGPVVALVIGTVMLASCGGVTSDARALEREGDLEGAVSLYREALKGDPDDVEVLAALGADLYVLGKFDEALPIQEKTVALDPEDVQTMIELGFNYLNHQDRPDDAVRVLTEAANVDPSAKNLTFLGQAQEVSQDTVGAEATFRKAIETDPKYAFSYMVLRNLLVKLGRAREAAQVEEAARQEGVDLNSSG